MLLPLFKGGKGDLFELLILNKLYIHNPFASSRLCEIKLFFSNSPPTIRQRKAIILVLACLSADRPLASRLSLLATWLWAPP
jgi:hypothetical protein